MRPTTRFAGRSLAVAAFVLALGLAAGGPTDLVWAHGKEKHGAGKTSPPELPAGLMPTTATSSGLPFDLDIRHGFSGLIDAKGETKSLADFRGRHVLLFFGYANCEAICSAALPDMARTVDFIGADTDALTPVMITVDPERDQPEAMGTALAKIDPRLYGLTGPDQALADARKAFQVETEQVGTDWFGKPIFSHGSFIYLIGPDGKLETLMPPVLGPERMAKIVKRYL